MNEITATLRTFDRDGVAVVPGVLPPEHVERLRGLLSGLIEDDLERWSSNPHYRDQWMVMNLMARHVDFALLMEHPVIQQHLCAVLGPTCIVYAYTSSSIPPTATNYSHRIHIDCPRIIPGYVTNVGLIVALDDFTAENGATYFLPGSHTQSNPPTEAEFIQNAIRVYPRAGDAVLFNARTWHMGGRNETPRPRHAITINACRSFMRQQFDYPRLVPQTIITALSDEGRRFLGMRVRMPTSLEEYYVPASERLYQANQG